MAVMLVSLQQQQQQIKDNITNKRIVNRLSQLDTRDRRVTITMTVRPSIK